MSEVPVNPQWPKILSLSVHEFRSPLTVVAGYIRMLLKDRAGPLSEQQRRLLEEAEKACARLTGLLLEVSDLSSIEAGAPMQRQATDLHHVLRAAVEQLPSLPDREVSVELQLGSDPVPISADPSRLIDALKWIFSALRRELVTSDRLIVRERTIPVDGAAACELQIGDEETLAALDAEAVDDRMLFDEWRGGCGLTLPVARRILDAHDGRIWGAPGGRKAGARIVLLCGAPSR
jgi:K+-sensing histidine kinase KdpD